MKTNYCHQICIEKCNDDGGDDDDDVDDLKENDNEAQIFTIGGFSYN